MNRTVAMVTIAVAAVIVLVALLTWTWSLPGDSELQAQLASAQDKCRADLGAANNFRAEDQ